jgi:hypothetical protein
MKPTTQTDRVKTLAEMRAEESETQRRWEATTVATLAGDTIADLRIRFSRVENPTNWKLPVDKIFAEISEEERRITSEAITHFAGCVATWTQVGAGWRVTAVGYYAAIGA